MLNKSFEALTICRVGFQEEHIMASRPISSDPFPKSSLHLSSLDKELLILVAGRQASLETI